MKTEPKPCCYNCTHCDFVDIIYEDEDGVIYDYEGYYDCMLDRPEFDYETGCCEDYA